MEARRNAAGILFVLPSDKNALRCAKGEQLSLVQINGMTPPLFSRYFLVRSRELYGGDRQFALLAIAPIA